MMAFRTVVELVIVGAVAGYFAEPYLRPYVFDEGTRRVRTVRADDSEAEQTDRRGEAELDIFDVGDVEDDGLTHSSSSRKDGRKPRDGSKPSAETDASDDEGDDTIAPKLITDFIGEGEAPRPVHEEPIQGKFTYADWRSPRTLKKKLAARIISKVARPEIERVAEFLSDPENRLAVAQWELLYRSDLDKLTELMTDSHTSEDLTPLLNSLPWVASFVYDGELEKPEVALAMLRNFRLADPKMDEDIAPEGGIAPVGLKQRVAAAVALEFARQGGYYSESGTFGAESKPPTKEELEVMKKLGFQIPKTKRSRKKGGHEDPYCHARDRYLFYAESINQGKHNSSMDTLPGWLLRIVCGWQVSTNPSGFGSPTALRWLRDNESVPANMYTAVCGHVHYSGTNIFADDIFSGHYYEPFEPFYPNNFAKQVRDVGGVCAQISPYGAAAANANGVPAITLSEPADKVVHCAYCVYHDGEWHFGFSVADTHIPGRATWGYGDWSTFMMMTAAYEDGARTRDAQMIATIAELFATERNAKEGFKFFEFSLGVQPLWRPVQDRYVDMAAEIMRLNPRRWQTVNEFICKSVAPRHPKVCVSILMEKVYPAMLKVFRSHRQKMQAFSSFWNHIREREKGGWMLDELLLFQYEHMGKGSSNRMDYLNLVLESAYDKVDFHPAVSWALRTGFEINKWNGKKLLEKLESLVESRAESEEAAEVRQLVDAAIIRVGEELGNAELVSKHSAAYLNAGGEPLDFKRPKGNLLTEGAYFQLGTYDNHPLDIVKHAAALTEQGGKVTCGTDPMQRLTVVLPKVSRIGTIVLVPTSGNVGGYNNWKLQLSRDGKEWEDITDLPESQRRPYLDVKLNRAPPARYVRIESKVPDPMNGAYDFKAFLIYDNQNTH